MNLSGNVARIKWTQKGNVFLKLTKGDNAGEDLQKKIEVSLGEAGEGKEEVNKNSVMIECSERPRSLWSMKPCSLN